MKSRLISTLFDDQQSDSARSFRLHLAETLALSEQVRSTCLGVLARARLANTTMARKKLLDALANDTGVEHSKLQRALGVMVFLLDSILDVDLPDSDTAVWADDLQELGCLNDETRPVFEDFIERLTADVCSKIQPEIRRRQTASGVLPCLKACGITVEIRGVRNEHYRWGMSIEEYRPQVIDVTPVVSIHISVDVGMPKHFCFQAEEDDLDLLLDSLTAAKRDLQALRAYLNLEPPARRDPTRA